MKHHHYSRIFDILVNYSYRKRYKSVEVEVLSETATESKNAQITVPYLSSLNERNKWGPIFEEFSVQKLECLPSKGP